MRITSLIIIIIDLLLTNLIKQTNKQTNKHPSKQGQDITEKHTPDKRGRLRQNQILKKAREKKRKKKHY